MDVVDTAQINSFAPIAAQTDFPVSPTEESVFFILTSSQLQDLIKDAIQPALDELSQLRDRIAHLEAEHEQDTTRICVDIALDRQRISRLEKIEPTPTQKDRADILHLLLAANGGKMLSSDARRKMRVPKSSFSELLKTCDFLEIRPFHGDARKDVLVLKNRS